jgi:hypothetical protein
MRRSIDGFRDLRDFEHVARAAPTRAPTRPHRAETANWSFARFLLSFRSLRNICAAEKRKGRDGEGVGRRTSGPNQIPRFRVENDDRDIAQKRIRPA